MNSGALAVMSRFTARCIATAGHAPSAKNGMQLNGVSTLTTNSANSGQPSFGKVTQQIGQPGGKPFEGQPESMEG
jgi:hypothetical protein